MVGRQSTGRILGIDPGPKNTAWAEYCTSDHRVRDSGLAPNLEMRSILSTMDRSRYTVACERFMPYGQRLQVESLETIWWEGRFAEVLAGELYRIPRRDVKIMLCGKPNVKNADAAIRHVLIDRFGGSRQEAVGTKDAPGPCYGVSTHRWQALAVAVTLEDTLRFSPEQAAEWWAQQEEEAWTA